MALDLPNLDSLLAPISDTEPLGTRLPTDDFSSPLVQFQQACRSAFRLENADDEAMRDKAAEAWEVAAQQGLQIIDRQWKDLDVAVSLTQALTKTNGVAGLRFGYQLCGGLLGRYWAEMVTSWQGNSEEGLRKLSDLNSSLLPSLRRQEIADSGPVRYFQHVFAQKLEGMSPEERESQVLRGAMPMSDVQRCVAETDTQYYVQLLEEIRGAKEAIDQTVNVIAEHLDDDQQHALPATSNVTELLEELELALRGLVGDRLESDAGGSEDSVETGEEDSQTRSATGSPGQPLNRDAALRQLEQLAVYLERLERQSLVPVVVRYAVWLARLSPQQFFLYYNERGEQLFQILEPILGSSDRSNDDSE